MPWSRSRGGLGALSPGGVCAEAEPLSAEWGSPAGCHPATLSWSFGPAKLNRALLPAWRGQDPEVTWAVAPVFKRWLLEGAELSTKREYECTGLWASRGTGGGLLGGGCEGLEWHGGCSVGGGRRCWLQTVLLRLLEPGLRSLFARSNAGSSAPSCCALPVEPRLLAGCPLGASAAPNVLGPSYKVRMSRAAGDRSPCGCWCLLSSSACSLPAGGGWHPGLLAALLRRCTGAGRAGDSLGCHAAALRAARLCSGLQSRDRGSRRV